jgi:hypothetical protein
MSSEGKSEWDMDIEVVEASIVVPMVVVEGGLFYLPTGAQILESHSSRGWFAGNGSNPVVLRSGLAV